MPLAPTTGPVGPPEGPRVHVVLGILIAVVVLVALIWFAVTHTDTGDRTRSLFGTAAPTEGAPATPP